jgi:hypothetical protein
MTARRKWIWIAVLGAVFVIPFVIALVVLHQPRWYPVLDMAETELRVRDVASSHPPLIGLAGRIGPFGPNGGSHPGPLSFYALWPVYALFGQSSYGLHVSTVVLDLIAIGLSLWMAFRRGGWWLVFGMAGTLALLLHAYGAFLLTLPWNPYLPVLWWFVFLLAVWSVFLDDFAMLPVAIFAGSLCSQTEVSYVGLIGGFVAFLVALLVWAFLRLRGDPVKRRSLILWTAIAFVFGIVLWLPPIIDQAVHSPGNIRVTWDYFSHPPATDHPVGVSTGIGVLLSQLNPFKFVSEILVGDVNPHAVGGTRLPGLFLLVAFGGSVWLAVRAKARALLRLDIVIAVALALGFISASRILGTVFYYLLLWAWGLVALMLLAIGWAIAVSLPANRRKGASVLIWLTALALVAFTVDAARVTVQSPRLNADVRALAGPAEAALAAREKAGAHGPYLVTWLPDDQAIGSVGYGVFNELLRHGYNAKASVVFPGATRYHVMDPEKATIQVHVATGPDIAYWTQDSRFHLIKAFDPRTDAERAHFDQFHGELVDELERSGHPELVKQIDDNLFMLALAPGLTDRAHTLISQMLAIGLPVAVFIGPPGDPPKPQQ